MIEYLDIYDDKRNKINREFKRDIDKLEQGEYILVVQGVILNKNNQILISKRSETKKTFPLKWECNGGAARKGEESIDAIIRELKEEIGLELKKEDAKYIRTIKNEEKKFYKDIWAFKMDITIDDIKHNDGEVAESKFVTFEEFHDIYESGETIPVEMITKDDYFKAIGIE